MDKLLNTPPTKPLSNPSSPSSSLSSGVSQISSPRGKKRGNPESALALVEPDRTRLRAGHVSSAPLCRPWDRGDFMRRLATFKSMTWFAKPKANILSEVVSAVNCARRGWINLDTDIIACEACGARLLFSTPSSWSQKQGTSFEKAALVFSLKLDNGHKLLCPWIDNACDERLAEFPPTPPQILVDKFRERSCALLQLLALPLISASAIEYMRCPQLEEFLRQSPTVEYGNGSANLSEIQFLGNDCDADSANLYYQFSLFLNVDKSGDNFKHLQAQKLISLCGWEPRVLPYAVDCNGRPTQPVKDSVVTDSSHMVINGQNPSIQVHSVATEQSVEANEQSGSFSGAQADPNAVVLDCRLCGASVGLWSFSMVPRPLELFRLVGYTEVNGNKNSGQDSANENHADDRGVVGNFASNGVTIAGGPPPTKQNFKATISLPVIGRNLRARLSYDSDFRDRTSDNQEVTQSGSEDKNPTSEERESAEHNFGEQVSLHEAVGPLKSKIHDQGQCSYASGDQSSCLNFESSEGGALRKENNSQMSVEETGITREPIVPETSGHDSAVEHPIQGPPKTMLGHDATDRLPENSNNIELLDSVVGVLGGSQVSASSISGLDAIVSLEMVTSSINHDGQQIPRADISGSKSVASRIDVRGGETCSDIQNTLGAQEKSQEATTDGVQVEVVAYGTGKDHKQLALDKSLGFDPIRQHRHFCPWIVSSSSAPGWQQTLSALERQKNFSHSSTNSPPSSSLIKVDDPIASVRKLFMSSVKRMKPTSGSS
ncbi:unnamed protein product [Dovyalis caffra]|uniref:C3HC-type domain-containing protein n=1 Tax=Dovyalis caffra TaxID=77055 RepID=A0AAV1QN79_9ROSI|nr:unnamed protein product [Dovyalis caffra]